MIASEMAKMIGKQFSLRVAEGFAVSVEVLDMKSAYGQVRALVAPVAGMHHAWVSVDRLRPVDEYPQH